MFIEICLFNFENLFVSNCILLAVLDRSLLCSLSFTIPVISVNALFSLPKLKKRIRSSSKRFVNPFWMKWQKAGSNQGGRELPYTPGDHLLGHLQLSKSVSIKGVPINGHLVYIFDSIFYQTCGNFGRSILCLGVLTTHAGTFCLKLLNYATK